MNKQVSAVFAMALLTAGCAQNNPSSVSQADIQAISGHTFYIRGYTGDARCIVNVETDPSTGRVNLRGSPDQTSLDCPVGGNSSLTFTCKADKSCTNENLYGDSRAEVRYSMVLVNSSSITVFRKTKSRDNNVETTEEFTYRQ